MNLAHVEAGTFGVNVNHHYSRQNPGMVFAVNCYLSQKLVNDNAPNSVIENTQNNNLARRERGKQLAQELRGTLDVAALARILSDHANRERDPMDNPLLELVCLVYLLNAGPEHISQEMISVQELKSAHFFTGPHELKVKPLLKRYGNDLDGFKKAAEGLGGEALDLAGAAYKFLAFPKVPLYYLFWAGDDEFDPRLSILFDRSIEHHLAADAIWGLVNLVSDILTEAAR